MEHDYYIAIALILAASLMTVFLSLPVLKILQLSGYKARGVFAWLKATKYDALIRYFAFAVMSFVAMIVFIGCFTAYAYVRYIAVLLYLIIGTVFSVTACKKGAGVVFTGRMIRIIVCDCVIHLLLGVWIAVASYFSTYFQSLVALFGILAPFTAIASEYIMCPFEELNNKKYIRRAKARLAVTAPTVIGITGSFGKTTAKNILCEMLKSAGSVIATPGSYNTPMGVCKTVNGAFSGEKFLIAELGARYPGDIKELCDIVNPKIGIITAIGDMHLETLKDREGVAAAKFELAESLPENGVLVLNGYNPDCKKLADRGANCKTVVTGAANGICADDIEIGANGTSFTLKINGFERRVTSKLLGAHIAELSCACAAAALECGATAEDIADAIERIEPVEHRLQLLPANDAQVTVIDDAYNSNPIGAKNALDVLKCFDGKKKIVITPGFVELGAIEKDCNTEYGKQIAEVCDYAFLVGSRAADIKKGATDSGMVEGAISEFESRDEAVKALSTIVGEKVILFENDLPDNIK